MSFTLNLGVLNVDIQRYYLEIQRYGPRKAEFGVRSIEAAGALNVESAVLRG